MEFSDWNEKIMRRRLERTNFYEDVLFENDFVKESVQIVISEWIYNLKEYKSVKVKKFKDLFIKFNEIMFPIKIKDPNISTFGINIYIVDRFGRKYYFYKESIYENINEYYIGKRNTESKPFWDKEIHYRIHENGIIGVLGKEVVKLKEDGTNGDLRYKDYHNANMQVIEVSDSCGKIKIEYPLIENIRKVIFAEFLKSDEPKWYYYDVFPIFKCICNRVEDCDIGSMHIVAEIEKEVYSEIQMVDNIVQKYTVTQIITEEEMHIIGKIFAKKLDEFLAEKQ